ncbi:GWxTD domain-containing protein [Candidatus Zixiibacteriota bacterium]
MRLARTASYLRRDTKRLLGCLLIAGCALNSPDSPEITGRGGPMTDWIETNVSLALFRPPEGSDYLLHIHVSFPRSRLFFLRRQLEPDTLWRAQYEMRIVIRERNALQRGGGVHVDTIELDEELLTSDPFARVRLFQQVAIPPGLYRVEVIISDRQSVRSGRVQQEVDAAPWEAGEPGLSQIELLDPTAVQHESTLVEVSEAHAREVLSSLRNPADATFTAFLYETYDIPAGSSIQYRLISDDGNEARSRQGVTPLGSMTVRDTISTAGLTEGRYSLQLQLEGPGGLSLTGNKTIHIRRPLLAWGDDLETTSSQLSLFAGEDALEALADLPDIGRRAFLDSIWLALDPTPDTVKNEVRDEFVRRLQYADQEWRSGLRRGWDVDIGRIYIAFGEPDEIIDERLTRTPVRPLEEPRQIIVRKWIYRESAVTFAFIYEPERGWVLDQDRSNTIPP